MHPSLFDTNTDDHGGFQGGHGTTITITLPTDKSGPASLLLWTTAEPSPG